MLIKAIKYKEGRKEKSMRKARKFALLVSIIFLFTAVLPVTVFAQVQGAAGTGTAGTATGSGTAGAAGAGAGQAGTAAGGGAVAGIGVGTIVIAAVAAAIIVAAVVAASSKSNDTPAATAYHH